MRKQIKQLMSTTSFKLLWSISTLPEEYTQTLTCAPSSSVSTTQHKSLISICLNQRGMGLLTALKQNKISLYNKKNKLLMQNNLFRFINSRSRITMQQRLVKLHKRWSLQLSFLSLLLFYLANLLTFKATIKCIAQYMINCCISVCGLLIKADHQPCLHYTMYK